METLKEQNERINRLSINLEEAIENAMNCHKNTISCLQHCIIEGGNHANPTHLNLLMECAEITQITQRLMINNSNFLHDTCALCSKICEACASSCEEIDPNDVVMKTCIESCRKCAESCRNMEH